MKNKKLCNYVIPMNLQLFAEGGDTGGNGGESGGDGGEGGQTQSFDDFLKGEGNQEEFDRRVQTAVDTAVIKARDKWKAMTDDKLSEAEKLSKMTKEEKEEYLKQKREKEIADREASVTRRELAAEAKGTLAEKGLPVELAEVLNYTDAEACKKSMESVEKAFQKAVEAAVEEKLKGGKPPKKPPETDEQKTQAEQIYNIMAGR